MKNYLTMSQDEFRVEARLTSKMLAFRDFQRRNRAATDDQAHGHAERFWRNYLERALDFLAVVQVDAEAQAAPWN